tara:strand:- start:203 stop:541 length:339 start_codon:yes stop_codon:yes gene_type:complete
MNINKLHNPRAAAQLDEAKAVELAEIFRLMGDQNRLRIILACTGDPICVGDIAAELGIAPSLVSHNLRLLKATRLVRANRKGKQIYYTVADDHISCVIADMVDHVSEPGETS